MNLLKDAVITSIAYGVIISGVLVFTGFGLHIILPLVIGFKLFLAQLFFDKKVEVILKNRGAKFEGDIT